MTNTRGLPAIVNYNYLLPILYRTFALHGQRLFYELFILSAPNASLTFVWQQHKKYIITSKVLKDLALCNIVNYKSDLYISSAAITVLPLLTDSAVICKM